MRPFVCAAHHQSFVCCRHTSYYYRFDLCAIFSCLVYPFGFNRCARLPWLQATVRQVKYHRGRKLTETPDKNRVEPIAPIRHDIARIEGGDSNITTGAFSDSSFAPLLSGRTPCRVLASRAAPAVHPPYADIPHCHTSHDPNKTTITGHPITRRQRAERKALNKTGHILR